MGLDWRAELLSFCAAAARLASMSTGAAMAIRIAAMEKMRRIVKDQLQLLSWLRLRHLFGRRLLQLWLRLLQLWLRLLQLWLRLWLRFPLRLRRARVAVSGVRSRSVAFREKLFAGRLESASGVLRSSIAEQRCAAMNRDLGRWLRRRRRLLQRHLRRRRLQSSLAGASANLYSSTAETVRA